MSAAITTHYFEPGEGRGHDSCRFCGRMALAPIHEPGDVPDFDFATRDETGGDDG